MENPTIKAIYIYCKDKNKQKFITHEDQENKGLSFCIRFDYCRITGDEKEILQWMARNDLTEIDTEVAETEIARLQKIAELEDI